MVSLLFCQLEYQESIQPHATLKTLFWVWTVCSSLVSIMTEATIYSNGQTRRKCYGLKSDRKLLPRWMLVDTFISLPYNTSVAVLVLPVWRWLFCFGSLGVKKWQSTFSLREAANCILWLVDSTTLACGQSWGPLVKKDILSAPCLVHCLQYCHGTIMAGQTLLGKWASFLPSCSISIYISYLHSLHLQVG